MDWIPSLSYNLSLTVIFLVQWGWWLYWQLLTVVFILLVALVSLPYELSNKNMDSVASVEFSASLLIVTDYSDVCERLFPIRFNSVLIIMSKVCGINTLVWKIIRKILKYFWLSSALWIFEFTSFFFFFFPWNKDEKFTVKEETECFHYMQ